MANETRAKKPKLRSSIREDAINVPNLLTMARVVMIPLVLWFGFSLASLPQASHADLVGWISSPPVTVALVLLILTVFYHAQQGLQVVIEDYISTHWQRTIVIIAVSLLCLLLAVIGVIAVLRIALGG